MANCYLKVKLKGLTFKMRNKINEHGPWWNSDGIEGTIVISTLNKVHNRGLYEYTRWVTVGKDVEILEHKKKE